MQCGSRVDGRWVRWHVARDSLDKSVFFLSLQTRDNTDPPNTDGASTFLPSFSLSWAITL